MSNQIIHWKVVGIQTGTSKKGNPMAVLHLSRPSNRPELQGEEVKSHFIFGELLDSLRQISLGDFVEVYYNQSGFAQFIQKYES